MTKVRSQHNLSASTSVCSTTGEWLEPVLKNYAQQICLKVAEEVNRVFELISNHQGVTDLQREVHVANQKNVDSEMHEVQKGVDHQECYLEFIKEYQATQNQIEKGELETNYNKSGKNLNDETKYMDCDLTDAGELEKLVSKIHHNLGSYHWETMGKHLRWMGVPKLFYEGMKKHIQGCARMKINGARPLARPAKFPMASAPFEILLLDFGRVEETQFFTHAGCIRAF